MNAIPHIAIFIVLLTACSTTAVKEPETSPWVAFGYRGMAGEVNRLAGKESLNCGIHNHLDVNDPVNSHMTIADSRACIKSAIGTQTPFRYGSVRIPLDSYLFDALVLTASGEYWSIKYDSMLDGSDAQRFIERCDDVKIDYKSLQYEGIGCEIIKEDEWQDAVKAYE